MLLYIALKRLYVPNTQNLVIQHYIIPIIKQILSVKWFEIFPIMFYFTLMTKHFPYKVGQQWLYTHD
jgi:hypothetical protein